MRGRNWNHFKRFGYESNPRPSTIWEDALPQSHRNRGTYKTKCSGGKQGNIEQILEIAVPLAVLQFRLSCIHENEIWITMSRVQYSTRNSPLFFNVSGVKHTGPRFEVSWLVFSH